MNTIQVVKQKLRPRKRRIHKHVHIRALQPAPISKVHCLKDIKLQAIKVPRSKVSKVPTNSLPSKRGPSGHLRVWILPLVLTPQHLSLNARRPTQTPHQRHITTDGPSLHKMTTAHQLQTSLLLLLLLWLFLPLHHNPLPYSSHYHFTP